ncbi:excalibur calcium-binding domain-containing protein [Streptomyces sp. NPDC048002]|uniref:excalibur calcium-binding domain-containing protein n=1 Tax=Streptomyces sp. NPDC048002 TaxID=3154344 RepID=UPI0033EBA7E2
MTNPFTVPQPARPAPRWARKRYVLPALFVAFGIGMAAGGGEQPAEEGKAVAVKSAQPTATVTATMTASPEPAPTVTETVEVKVKVTKTVTEEAVDIGNDDEGGSGGSVYYANCSEARAAGAAPILAGEPGYASHLDRDGDGVGCDS